jgi:hypothetical protein
MAEYTQYNNKVSYGIRCYGAGGNKGDIQEC